MATRKRKARGPKSTGLLTQEGLNEHGELQYLRASAVSASSRREPGRRRRQKKGKTKGELDNWVEERAGKMGREADQHVRAEASAGDDLGAKLDELVQKFDRRRGAA